MVKKRRKARQKHEQDSLTAPTRGKDRPTPERATRGIWGLFETEDAGIRHARDVASHPIDALEWRGVLSSDQASAGRDYEALYRAANEAPGIRDSCTLWEPKGYESDDGPIHAVRDRRELYLFLGVVRDRQLRRVCVEHVEPKPDEVGLLREALNECVRFFKPKR